MDIETTVLIILSIFTVINSIFIVILIVKMKDVKEIFNDHKQNIEILIIRADSVKKLLNLKENG